MANPNALAPDMHELRPMLLKRQPVLPTGEEWSFELKFDGYRILASTGRAAQLRTKEGADATKWFPELIDSLAAMPDGHILDGEVCVLDDIGRSDFNRLHKRALKRRYVAGADIVTYCVFDHLSAKGMDRRGQPIEQRRRSLARLLAKERPNLLHVTSIDDGEALFKYVLALELEGVVAKRAGSTYQSGVVSPDWIKIRRAEAAQGFKR